MKLIITADLHFGSREAGNASVREIASEIAQSDADALVLAGDNAAVDPELFQECFSCFDGFNGRKFTLCGNHDLWTRDGDSLQIYREGFPEMAQAGDFEYLEGQPATFGNVGLVGTAGWYDYSFRDESIDIDDRYYEQKSHPKLAKWNDGAFVKLGMSDPEFNELVLNRLEQSIESIYDQVEVVVAVTHLIAFDCMLIQKPERAWRFCNAFRGSRSLGNLLLKYPKIRYHFCGHTHVPGRHRVGQLETINIGSTYLEKRYEVLEL